MRGWGEGRSGERPRGNESTRTWLTTTLCGLILTVLGAPNPVASQAPDFDLRNLAGSGADRVEVHVGQTRTRSGAEVLIGLTHQHEGRRVLLAYQPDAVGAAPSHLPGDTIRLIWPNWSVRNGGTLESAIGVVERTARILPSQPLAGGEITRPGWVHLIRAASSGRTPEVFPIFPQGDFGRSERLTGAVPDAVLASLRSSQDSVIRVRRAELGDRDPTSTRGRHHELYFAIGDREIETLVPGPDGEVPGVLAVHGPAGRLWFSQMSGMDNPDDKAVRVNYMTRLVDDAGSVVFQDSEGVGIFRQVISPAPGAPDLVHFLVGILWYDGIRWRMTESVSVPFCC
jgi:hypothetical protein